MIAASKKEKTSSKPPAPPRIRQTCRRHRRRGRKITLQRLYRGSRKIVLLFARTVVQPALLKNNRIIRKIGRYYIKKYIKFRFSIYLNFRSVI